MSRYLYIYPFYYIPYIHCIAWCIGWVIRLVLDGLTKPSLYAVCLNAIY